MTEHRLDPLGDIEVKRVLAFARAREQYPSVPRGLLLDYCQAAWQAALAGGEDGDVVGRFERALVMVAWTHRRSPNLSFRDLIDQVIPQVALRPFMSPEDGIAAEEPVEEPVVQAEPAVQPDAPRPPARRLLPRVPFASPIPLGAAVAAGFIGVTVLGQSGALPVAPFAPAGNDDASTGSDAHHGDKAAAAPAVQHGAGGSGSSSATGTRIGLAAAPQAAEAFRAPAVTTGGGGTAAPKAPAAPAQPVSAPVSAPASAPAAPAQTAPAAPVEAVPQAVDEVEQQAPDTGGAEELAQAPEKHHGSWKDEPDAQLPEQDPATAPAEPAPDSEVTAPDVQGEPPAAGDGEEHGAERHQHSDQFAPIDLGQAGQDHSAAGQDDSAPAENAAAPEPPAEVRSAPEPAAKAPAPKPALDVPKPAQVGPPAAPQQQAGQGQGGQGQAPAQPKG